MPVLPPRQVATLLRPYLVSGPAYAGVAAGLRSLLLDGRLPSGSRLPSERDLAAALGASRTTVTAGYDLLREQGFVRSRRGAGSTLLLPDSRAVRPLVPGSALDPAAGAAERDDVLDLAVAALPAPSVLAELAHEAADALPAVLGGHGLHPLGLPALREAVAERFSARGLRTDAGQVLVTSGALHGWDLVLRALARPGARVLVEQPSYPSVLDAVLARGLRPVPLPVSADGWDLVAAPDLPGLAHVTPDAQNPTGLIASAEQRRELLAALPSATFVADETFADLLDPGVVEAGPPPPLAALAPPGRVLTVGSLSKSVWPGLRVGWVRAPADVVRRLATARGGQDLASPVLEQLLAVAVLARGGTVLAERRELLRRRRQALLAALAEHAPTWRIDPPQGGMVAWIDLGESVSTALAELAATRGVRLAPGPRFGLGGTHDRFLRLPFTLAEEEYAPLVRRLHEWAQQLRPAQGRAGRRERPGTWTA
ncbi:DNA-binding transcriptional MocR family regulator [Kineococcus xinjiangensis]|uniref:DNA-binding transcriptional MocR family regulator n=1 Tax=Kineococcus xinjiangensis TaxID=512762 RepID=A0A2S6IUR5_9ACTN|nr:PLP-dependent aminotransferase family protein [Kineococcus xinjiangensis]PPK97976.1 DNA-binding transcriptional MocR family regulator [Kineococcus xinjiangensis]